MVPFIDIVSFQILLESLETDLEQTVNVQKRNKVLYYNK